MARHEFTRETRREALKRSGNKCEASGLRYGLDEGQLCNCSLSVGVIFDHDVPDQLGGDNSLENCRVVCVTCNKFKTLGDIRQIRKSDRQRDKASAAAKQAAAARQTAPSPAGGAAVTLGIIETATLPSTLPVLRR